MVVFISFIYFFSDLKEYTDNPIETIEGMEQSERFEHEIIPLHSWKQTPEGQPKEEWQKGGIGVFGDQLVWSGP